MKKAFSVLILMLAIWANTMAQTTYYVKPQGSDTNDGTSWATAKKTVQAAVDAASSGNQVFVQQGIYTLTATLTMKQGVNVYGGFAGTETSLSQRPQLTGGQTTGGQASILDANASASNARRVLHQSASFTTETVWDGFVLKNGYLTGSSDQGGGAYLTTGGKLNNCTIAGNTAYAGGGIICYSGGVVSNCIITNNTGSNGGGVHCSYGTVTNCTIINNTSDLGGGVYCSSDDSFTNCTITNNTASSNGGGVYCSSDDSFTNCTITNNTASSNGGGVYCRNGGDFTNCIIWGNKKGNDFQQIDAISGSAHVITYCAVQGGYAGTGTDNINLNENNTGAGSGVLYPSFTTPTTFAGVVADADSIAAIMDADWSIRASSACIDAGNITGLTLPAVDLAGNPRIVNSRIDMGAYEYQSNATATATIYYVKTAGDGGNDNNDGTSWAAAKTLTGALSVAVSGDSIFVRQGIYTLTAELTMKEGVNVYGGFAGTETSPDKRPALIGGKTSGGQASILDANASASNARRVLSQSAYFTTETVWDGFVLKNGYTAFNGGGVSLMIGGKLSNCTITKNATGGSNGCGGGIVCSSGGTVTNCMITGNAAYAGGGIICYSGGVVSNCTITNNAGSYGGGVYCSSGGTLNNCTIANNTASSYGGGVYYDSDGSLTNCIIWGNKRGNNFYQINYSGTSTPAITYCAVQSDYTGTGTGNIKLEATNTGTETGKLYPSFATPTTFAGTAVADADSISAIMNADWSITASSACIDKGIADTTGLKLPAVDLAGNPRIVNGRIEMGAYEYQGNAPVVTTTYYVKTAGNGGNDNNDGTSWATAKATVQAAVNAASSGNQVFVMQGTYTLTAQLKMKEGVNVYGGFAGTETSLSDRPVLIGGKTAGGQASILDANANARDLRSVLYQPARFTITETVWDGFVLKNGYTESNTNGGGVSLMIGGKLSNCTITKNATNISNGYGGGIVCSSGGTVTNCMITDNTAYAGGGVYCSSGGTLTNCTITNNTASYGGGVYCSSSGSVNNCTITNNACSYGGGVFCENGGAFANCIIWGNKKGSNFYQIYYAGTSTPVFTYCAVQNDYIAGTGNIILEATNTGTETDKFYPSFAAPTTFAGADANNIAAIMNADWSIMDSSACIDKGIADTTGLKFPAVDLAGNPRIVNGRIEMGAYEYQGNAPVVVTIYYVKTDGDGGNDNNDGTSWATAKATVQAAIDAASSGNLVFVQQGTYTLTAELTMKEGVNVYGGFAGTETSLSDRPALISGKTSGGQASILDANANASDTRRVLNQSVTFTTETVWDGFVLKNGYVTDVNNGGGASLRTGGKLTNCTITNNTTGTSSSVGGGVVCNGGGALTDCAITNNTGASAGGGVYCFSGGGALTNCTITGNTSKSFYGGGVYCSSGSVLTNCTIANNRSVSSGGGVYCATGSALTNCTITNNTSDAGGGVYCYYGGVLTNCTIADNTASSYGGGVYYSGGGTLTNCIIWGNKKSDSFDQIYVSGTPAITYCAVQNDYAGTGTGNITLEAANTGTETGKLYPSFVSPADFAGAATATDSVSAIMNANWRITSKAACVDAGTPDTSGLKLPAVDLAGNPRVVTGRIDMGAYEYIVISSDTTLASLNVSEGELTPAFDPTITDYTVTVNASISNITIAATAIYAKVSGAGTKTLASGANPFEIVVTAQDGTSKTYTVNVVRSISTGLAATESGRFFLYPNPASDLLHINLEEITGEAHVWIFNMQGVVCYEQRMQGGATHEISVRNFAAGIYFVKVNGNVLKLIINS